MAIRKNHVINRLAADERIAMGKLKSKSEVISHYLDTEARSCTSDEFEEDLIDIESAINGEHRHEIVGYIVALLKSDISRDKKLRLLTTVYSAFRFVHRASGIKFCPCPVDTVIDVFEDDFVNDKWKRKVIDIAAKGGSVSWIPRGPFENEREVEHNWYERDYALLNASSYSQFLVMLSLEGRDVDVDLALGLLRYKRYELLDGLKNGARLGGVKDKCDELLFKYLEIMSDVLSGEKHADDELRGIKWINEFGGGNTVKTSIDGYGNNARVFFHSIWCMMNAFWEPHLSFEWNGTAAYIDKKLGEMGCDNVTKNRFGVARKDLVIDVFWDDKKKAWKII